MLEYRSHLTEHKHVNGLTQTNKTHIHTHDGHVEKSHIGETDVFQLVWAKNDKTVLRIFSIKDDSNPKIRIFKSFLWMNTFFTI